jgi:hypothetical protein
LQANPTKIKITDAFTNSAYTTINVPFYIACDGFKNPRTTRVTSSFALSTYDSSGNAIEAISTGVTVQMLTRPDLTDFSVQIGSGVNGAKNTYKI